jgi:hypothetical protein
MQGKSLGVNVRGVAVRLPGGSIAKTVDAENGIKKYNGSKPDSVLTVGTTMMERQDDVKLVALESESLINSNAIGSSRLMAAITATALVATRLSRSFSRSIISKVVATSTVERSGEATFIGGSARTNFLPVFKSYVLTATVANTASESALIS